MKKNISLFLVFVLVIGLLATPSLAAYRVTYDLDGGKIGGKTAVDDVYSNDEDAYITLKDAAAAVGTPTKTNYKFVRWDVYDKDGNKIYEINSDTEAYKIFGDVTLKAVWKYEGGGGGGTGGGSTTAAKAYALPSLTPGPDSFDDVFETDWFYQFVMWASRVGLMIGYGDGKFGPNDPVTGAVMIQVLYNMSGEKVETISEKYANEWYGAAATWAESKGISFSTGVLTRENAIVMLYSFAKSMGLVKTDAAKGDLTQFGDAADVSAAAKEALEWAVGAGIINGMGNGNVEPTGATTRAQLTAMLYRLIA